MRCALPRHPSAHRSFSETPDADEMKCLLNLEIMSAHDFDLDFLYVQVCTKCPADDDLDVD